MFEAKLSDKAWGFRFSRVDAVALAVISPASAAFALAEIPLGWLLAVVASHFFLFCNVFRVRRQRELIWAAVFVLNVGPWAMLGCLDWRLVLACQAPFTLALLAWEIRNPSYHGILANRLNPRLNDYLAGQPNL